MDTQNAKRMPNVKNAKCSGRNENSQTEKENGTTECLPSCLIHPCLSQRRERESRKSRERRRGEEKEMAGGRFCPKINSKAGSGVAR